MFSRFDVTEHSMVGGACSSEEALNARSYNVLFVHTFSNGERSASLMLSQSVYQKTWQVASSTRRVSGVLCSLFDLWNQNVVGQWGAEPAASQPSQQASQPPASQSVWAVPGRGDHLLLEIWIAQKVFSTQHNLYDHPNINIHIYIIRIGFW